MGTLYMNVRIFSVYLLMQLDMGHKKKKIPRKWYYLGKGLLEQKSLRIKCRIGKKYKYGSLYLK